MPDLNIARLYLFVALFFIAALQLATVAARSACLQANHAGFLTLREKSGRDVSRGLTLLASLTRLKASLSLALVLLRFLLAGVVIALISLQTSSTLLWGALGLLVSAFVVFWLEWTIEQVVSRQPEVWVLRLALLGRFWMALTALPLILPLALSRSSQSSLEASPTVTEDEVKTLVDAGEEEGIFEQGERQMIYSVFELGDTLAREIMVPRIDILALEVQTSLEEALDAFIRSGHSRLPVYEETIDHTLGLLYAKDLLRVWRDGEHLESLRPLLRPAYFIPEAKKVDELLTEMQSQRIHMAIVVDEYGGVAGLVTMEDIVEEILGEIQDEYDQNEETPYQALEDGGFLFQGRIDLDDFNQVMMSDLPKEEADTLGGYIYSRLGRVPNVGETIRVGNLLLTVEQVSARRIRKVRAGWLTVEAAQEKENRDADEG